MYITTFNALIGDIYTRVTYTRNHDYRGISLDAPYPVYRHTYSVHEYELCIVLCTEYTLTSKQHAEMMYGLHVLLNSITVNIPGRLERVGELNSS